jgi:aminopeptidase-like protein
MPDSGAGMVDFLSLTRELCAIPSGIVHDGNTRLFARIADELPLTMHRFRSGDAFNGWQIPEKWTVETATIHKDGNLVFDGRDSPLGVAAYSDSFQGSIDLEDLRPRLFSRSDHPDAHFWHCSWLYRPWERHWGFCPPHRVVAGLPPGRYDIDLRTRYEPGEMLVAHHDHRGRSDRTIVFHSNTCHPHMANDGLAGTAVMIRLFQWLAGQDTRYTYRLLLGPEHYGSIFYLRDQSQAEIERYLGGVYGEMMGTDGPFVVAGTFTGDHYLDRVFRHVVSRHARQSRFVGFRASAGNDETVWEAPGYEVPFIQVNRSLSRHNHFPEYHSDLDTPDLMDHGQLDEFFEAFKRVIELIETDAVLHRRFNGLIALSNPAYNLYVSRPDPALDHTMNGEQPDTWGHLQDCIVRYFEGDMTILDIAERHDLDFFELRAYLESFRDKGLVSFSQPDIPRRKPRWVDGWPPER